MICVFDIGNENFTGNGDAVLVPTRATVKQVAGGAYDLTMEHPVDPEGKWAHLVPGAIVRVPVPEETIENAYAGYDVDVYKANTDTNMRTGPHLPNTISYTAWYAAMTWTVGSKVSYGGRNWECTYFDANSGGTQVPPPNISWWKEIPKATNGDPVLMTLSVGTELYLVEEYDSEWYIMSTPYGLTGYVPKAFMTYDHHLTPSETKARTITEQLFRLREPTVNTEKMTVSVTGQHVSYDLSGILVKDVSISLASPALAIGRITANFMMEYRGTIATNLTGTEAGTYTNEIKGKNGTFALLDPDKGIVKTFDAKLTRDNWDIFVMQKPEQTPVYRFAYGKNMRGVTWKRSSTNLVTRVVPVAKAEGGEDLYLPEGYVDSSLINNYPVIIMERLNVQGQVGKETESGSGTTWTESALLDEMRAKAGERFSVDKADQIQVEITIQFEQAGDSAEYAWLKPLENVLLYDLVTAVDDRVGLSSTLEITEIEFDAIRRKITGLKMSNISDVEQTVAGYSLKDNSISADKLMAGVLQDAVSQAVGIMPQYADPEAERPTTFSVIDNLTSSSTTDALSANQGRVLNNFLTDNLSYINNFAVGTIAKQSSKQVTVPANVVGFLFTWYGSIDNFATLHYVCGTGSSSSPVVGTLKSGANVSVTSGSGKVTVTNNHATTNVYCRFLRIAGDSDITVA